MVCIRALPEADGRALPALCAARGGQSVSTTPGAAAGAAGAGAVAGGAGGPGSPWVLDGHLAMETIPSAKEEEGEEEEGEGEEGEGEEVAGNPATAAMAGGDRGVERGAGAAANGQGGQGGLGGLRALATAVLEASSPAADAPSPAPAALALRGLSDMARMPSGTGTGTERPLWLGPDRLLEVLSRCDPAPTPLSPDAIPHPHPSLP